MARDNIDIIISSFFDGKGFKSAQVAMQKTEQQAEKVGNRLRAIQVVLASIATGAALSYAKSITKIASEYETLILRLSQTEGGLKEARAQYEQFRQTFGKAGFDIAAATDGFQKLRVAGLSTEDAFKVVEAGANAVAAFGGGSQDLSRLIIGMTQAIGKGTLSMEEMRQQIGEAVPSAMRILAREYDVSIGEMFRRIEKGSVDSREAMLKLAEGFGEDFGGTLALKAQTLDGALANLDSSIRSSIGKLFTETTDGGAQLVAIINRLTESITGFIDGIDQGQMDRIMEFFNVLLDAATNIAPHIGFLFEALMGGIQMVAGEISNEVYGAGAAYGLIGLALGGRQGFAVGVLAGLASEIFQQFLSSFGIAANSLIGQMASILGGAASLGLIGYAIFGKSGGLIAGGAALIAGIYDKFFAETDKAQRKVGEGLGEVGKKLTENAEVIDNAFIDTVEKAEKLKERLETTEITFGSKTAEKFQKEIDKIVAEASRMEQKIAEAEAKGVTGPEQQAKIDQAKVALTDLMNVVAQLANLLNVSVAGGVAKFAQSVEAKARSMEAAMKGFEASVTNNQASSELLALESRTEGVRNGLIKLGQEYGRLGDAAGINKVNADLAKLDSLQKQGIANIGAETAATSALNGAKYEGLRLATERQLLDLRIQEAGTLFAGYADDAERRRLELQEAIISTGEQILQLEKEKIGATAETRQQIDMTIAKLKEFQGAQEAALASTSAAGMLAKETWGEVAGIIEDSLKGALRDLVKGTFDAEKALLAMYDKITDAAIDYLFELIKIQFRQQLIGAATGMSGGGGNIFGFLGGLFADGGAFKGQIKPFADGGIVRGPTLFGLAGEAGDEAIMPLERIGGKLGVRAVGGDGGTYNITIQAIDTQTGAQFLQKHSSQIINQLRSADRLNRGIGSVR